ncbi:MAG: hypothetical protein KJ949_00240 [Nanoarchaeota archaeon]|nr:hypothetical protein [Nanoarchaeota archaeon]
MKSLKQKICEVVFWTSLAFTEIELGTGFILDGIYHSKNPYVSIKSEIKNIEKKKKNDERILLDYNEIKELKEIGLPLSHPLYFYLESNFGNYNKTIDSLLGIRDSLENSINMYSFKIDSLQNSEKYNLYKKWNSSSAPANKKLLPNFVAILTALSLVWSSTALLYKKKD